LLSVTGDRNLGVRHISIDERRARLGVRHRLAASSLAATPAEVASGMVALHGTDPATVFLSIYARTKSVEVDTIERALYDERSLIRLLGMRRTVFVVPLDVAPVVQAACARAISAAQRQIYTRFLQEAGIGDGDWLRDVEEATARALVARGEATGAQLSSDEPRLRSQVVVAKGKPYESRQNVTTWVLQLLAGDGRIVRGRPIGSWLSTQYRWSPMESWLPGGMTSLSVEVARSELVRRWLAVFGPGTATDLRWWTGWTTAQVKQALNAVGAIEVDLEGERGFVLPDDLEPTTVPEPWVALLPALDPTPMGWSQRSWYVDPHGPALFDRSGNIAPTVWSNGKIIGGWAQRADGEVVYQPLEDIGAETAAAVEVEAARLAKWLGPTRLTPRTRIPTPLERELTA
jgi:hypothetical protein